jgi:maltose-binding protein MalE
VNRAATNDLTLVKNGASVVTGTNVTLNHKAIGAQKFRARNETNAWSAWQTFAPSTSWTLSPGNGAKTVQVQYWADGSAAYFVTAPATLQQDWRISAVAGQNAKVVRWPSVSNCLYTVTWSSNSLGPWTPLAVDLAPTPPQNTYTDAVHAADSQAYYRVSVRVP